MARVRRDRPAADPARVDPAAGAQTNGSQVRVLSCGPIPTNPPKLVTDTDSNFLFARPHVLSAALTQQVIPLFYERDAKGIPRQWLQRIRRAMITLVPQFTTRRMVRQYTEQYYLGT